MKEETGPDITLAHSSVFRVWETEFDQQGYIEHLQVPVFTAKWGREPDEISGVQFCDVGSDPEENLCIWDFSNSEILKDEDIFRDICSEAIRAIDLYLEDEYGDIDE